MSRERPLEDEDEEDGAEDRDLYRAWAAGHTAFEEGRGEHSNNFELGTAAWEEWRAGYYLAAQAARARPQ
jgi:hypothetical protein